jgi:hypothetical protein
MNAFAEKLNDLSNAKKEEARIFEEIVNLISSEVFVPTGSRFFGTNTPVSDFDFFVADNNEIVLKLVSLGFRTIREDYLNDISTTKVLRRGCIDIQVTRPEYFNAKIIARNHIKEMLELFPRIFEEILKSKIKAPSLWNDAIIEVYNREVMK